MRTPFVVELHIFGNPFLEFVFRPVGAPVQFFLLQRGEEGLHHTVVVGRAPFGEGLRHMAIAQKSSEGLGCILASPVRVEDQIFAGISFLKCPLEGGGHQLRACPRRDFVGDHLSGIQIQDGADVVFLAAHRKLGAVSYPCRVGRTDIELAVQDIGGPLELHPLFVIRLSRGSETIKPQFMHDAEDGLFAGFVSPALQYGKNFIGAEQPMVFLKNLFDSCRELLPSLGTKGRFLFAFHEIVECSPVYFQGIAEDPDRILIHKSFQLSEFYRNRIGSRANYRLQDLADLLRSLLFLPQVVEGSLGGNQVRRQVFVLLQPSVNCAAGHLIFFADFCYRLAVIVFGAALLDQFNGMLVCLHKCFLLLLIDGKGRTAGILPVSRRILCLFHINAPF